MTKRILVVTPWKRRWEMGNAAGVADDYYFISGFAAHGFEVHYLCPRDRGPEPSLDGYFVHHFPNVLDATERWPSLLKRPLWPFLFTAFAVMYGMRVAKRFPPSIVVGHTQLSAWAVRSLAKCLRVPSIVKLFGVENLDRTDWSRAHYLRKNIEQILAFKVHQDAWIILDDGTGGAAAAWRHGVAKERTYLLPNGINLEWGGQASAWNARQRYGVPNGTAVVLYLARLTEWKRPDAFIRSTQRILRGGRRPVVFWMAGDGPLRAACEQLAAALGVGSHIRFLGPVPHADVPALMAGATVFASTNRRTNRGIPTCEAMVCGVPVVAFDVGDTRAVVRDGDTGRLVRDGDVDGFSDAVVDLINDEVKRERMGQRSRALARDAFTSWPERISMEIRIVDGLLVRRENR